MHPLSDTPPSLDQLRHTIDAIDADIIHLLKQRLKVVHQVGHLKAQSASPNQCFLRPAREALMLKKLASLAHPEYPAETICRIWRAIITSSLYTERPFSLAIESPPQSYNYWLAREYFSSFIPTTFHNTVEEVLAQVSSHPSIVGIVSPNGRWWHSFAAADGYPVTPAFQVFARIPAYGLQESSFPHSALALAQITPEKTGNDVSLLQAITHRIDPLEALDSLKIVLQEHQHPVLSFQSNGNTLCLNVEGFLTDSSTGTFKRICQITEPYITSLVPLGCYSQQTDI